MGEQLSFESELYERERQLLFLIKEIGVLRSSLHYQRTKTVATAVHMKVDRHKEVMGRVEKKITSALEWIAQIEFQINKELSEIGTTNYKELSFFMGRISLNNLALDASTSPLDIYNHYIKIYRGLSDSFDEAEDLIKSIPACLIYIRELYVDLQEVGKELEEVL